MDKQDGMFETWGGAGWWFVKVIVVSVLTVALGFGVPAYIFWAFVR